MFSEIATVFFCGKAAEIVADILKKGVSLFFVLQGLKKQAICSEQINAQCTHTHSPYLLCVCCTATLSRLKLCCLLFNWQCAFKLACPKQQTDPGYINIYLCGQAGVLGLFTGGVQERQHLNHLMCSRPTHTHPPTHTHIFPLDAEIHTHTHTLLQKMQSSLLKWKRKLSHFWRVAVCVRAHLFARCKACGCACVGALMWMCMRQYALTQSAERSTLLYIATCVIILIYLLVQSKTCMHNLCYILAV